MRLAQEGPKNVPVNLSRSAATSYQDPTLSPDGKHLAFSNDREGNREIYRMSATDGANHTNLTNNPAPDEKPSWQPIR